MVVPPVVVPPPVVIAPPVLAVSPKAPGDPVVVAPPLTSAVSTGTALAVGPSGSAASGAGTQSPLGATIREAVAPAGAASAASASGGALDVGTGAASGPTANRQGAALAPVSAPNLNTVAGSAGTASGSASAAPHAALVGLAPASIDGAAALLLYQPVPDVVIAAGQRLALTLPSDTFLANGGGQVTLLASIGSGRPGEAELPLPSWITFDAAKGTLSGVPPADAPALLVIRITARDSTGNEVSVMFTIRNQAAKAAPPGAQAQLAGKHLLALLRTHSGKPGHAAGAATLEAAEAAAFELDLARLDADAGAWQRGNGGAPAHAPSLSAQLQREDQRFGAGGRATLHHLLALQSARPSHGADIVSTQ